MEENQKQTSGKYFHMMEAVGSNGKYQKIMIGLFCVVSMQVGSMSLGNPYYFAIPPYTNCPSEYRDQDCNNYVCNLPIQLRNAYLEQQISRLSTLGTRFGDYHCENADAISAAKGMFFIGSIIGYIILGMMADNLGRKLTLRICLLTGLIGYLFIIIGPNLTTVQIGLFLTGFGLENAFNLSLYFFSQVLQNSQRQKAAILFQSFFCCGGLLMVFYFYILKNWLPIFCIFCFVPLLICLLCSIYFIQQTPQFLIKIHSIQHVRKSLKFIAKINGKTNQFEEDITIKQQALQLLKSEYEKQINSENKVIFTFFDLIKYKSLHRITLCLSLGIFAVDFLYYAPVMLIDEFGFDFYVNGVIINCSELITYAFSYYFIIGLKRKRTAIILYSISLVCSIVLIFQHTNQICQDHCWSFKVIFQLIIIFIFRFSISLQFQLLLVYALQLYPVQIAGLGLSFISIIGTLPNTFIPQLITVSGRADFPFMVFFIIGSIIGISVSIPLRQTCGKAPQEKISQFSTFKNIKKMEKQNWWNRQFDVLWLEKYNNKILFKAFQLLLSKNSPIFLYVNINLLIKKYIHLYLYVQSQSHNLLSILSYFVIFIFKIYFDILWQ